MPQSNENKSCMRVDWIESCYAQSNENKSCMRVDWIESCYAPVKREQELHES